MPVSSGLDSALRLLDPVPLMAIRLFPFLLVILSCHNSLKTDRRDALSILFVDFGEFTVTPLKNRE